MRTGTASRLIFSFTAILLALGTIFVPGEALAQGTAKLDSGDTAWIITATALVLFMTMPGLALFYGGLVRSKNLLSVLMHCFAIACAASVIWLVIGYSIAFGGSNAIWGGVGKAFMAGIGADSLSGTIPEDVFFMFQMTFVIITPGLIVGAYVERIKFSAVLWFSSLWIIFVYAPSTHWIWGGGILADMGWLSDKLKGIGTMDFAGGLVVHANAGIAARTTSLAATSACRTMAPISITSPSSLMSARPSIFEMSTISDGLARRIFIVGSSVMPPANSFASSLSPRIFLASVTVIINLVVPPNPAGEACALHQRPTLSAPVRLMPCAAPVAITSRRRRMRHLSRRDS